MSSPLSLKIVGLVLGDNFVKTIQTDIWAKLCKDLEKSC